MMGALQNFLLFHALTCLRPNALGSEIINGKLAPPNSLQFMASLQDRSGYHRCGGSLISDNFVLTAAHCAGRDFPARVVLGTHDLRRPQTVRGIAQMCKHPHYQQRPLQNDIMLLKLSQRVRVCGRIRRIRLPPPNRKVPDNQRCQVAGWGMIRTAGRGVEDLRVVDVSVINQNVCKQQWGHLFPGVICAGGYRTNKGFCQGDSGGPLVCNGMAVGVVSFNRAKGEHGDCDYPNLPNVYTNVSKFRPWIDKILRQNGC